MRARVQTPKRHPVRRCVPGVTARKTAPLLGGPSNEEPEISARASTRAVPATMTQEYLAGELSILLGELRAAAMSYSRRREIDRLRHEAEEFPTTVLGGVTSCALDVAKALCWDSITRGDIMAFQRQAAISAQLYEFGICSRLLPKDYQPSTIPATESDQPSVDR